MISRVMLAWRTGFMVSVRDSTSSPACFDGESIVVMRDLQRLGVLDPSLARQTDVLADDLHGAAAEEVAPLSTDGQKLDRLPGVLAHEGLRGLDEVRVERAGQAFVGGDEHEQVALV